MSVTLVLPRRFDFGLAMDLEWDALRIGWRYHSGNYSPTGPAYRCLYMSGMGDIPKVVCYVRDL